MAAVDSATAATDSSLPRPAGLSSPPASNNAAKSDATDSELSDLDEMDEDIGDIVPDHYADDGRVPVFKPTMAEFKNFKIYMNKIDSYGMKSGIVKVVPPQEWLEKLPRLDEAVKTIRVREPIRQEIMGTSGTYRQTNILHGRSYNLAQWRQLCEQSEHQPPARRGERRAAERPTRTTRQRPERPAATSTTPVSKKRARVRKGKDAKQADEETETAASNRLPTPDSPSIKPEDDNDTVKKEVEEVDEVLEQDQPKIGSRQAKVVSTSARRKYNRKEAQARVEEESFRDFNYEMDISEFTKERCEELERTYWKTLTYAPPLYGADMPGSLFDDNTTSWNLGKLPNLLDVMGTKIPGVNTAYLYLGMWKATFAWHLEDVDLYSINFLHFGAPKQWYSISQRDARRFEAAMKSIWPADAKACDQFLRHKTFLISPSQLLHNFNIQVNKIVHYPGEFIVTYPYGYHSGYNLGYNCAEAVNFALDSWMDYGRIAKRCDCSQAQDSVWIDVREIERKLRGEETDYESEIEDDGPIDLPTPDSSVENQTSPSKKRKRGIGRDGEGDSKRFKARSKAPPREPCALCPNDIPSEPLLPTDDGRKVHRVCALYIPETYIETGEDGQELVMDLSTIKKARLDLRCLFCRSRKGACFQCSQHKCTRAYHATCAAAAGVFVEQGDIPVFGEDGKEYRDQAVEFSCRFHRTRRDKHIDNDALENDTKVRETASKVAMGETCQFQYLKGEIFAGVVAENRTSEETLVLDLLPRGDRIEVEYKYLIVPDAADYHLPKPSPNAVPLPSRKAKAALEQSKREARGIPEPDDLFAPGYRWAQFESYEPQGNFKQAKVEFSKPDQVWFYLGEISTEYRSHFTENPRNRRHNPKSNFLDSIPKPAPIRNRQSFAASHPTGFVNQNALNAARVITPSHTQGGVKMDNPHFYKPRVQAPAYSIDPQAYQSQQSFVQNIGPRQLLPQAIPRNPMSSSHIPFINAGAPNLQYQNYTRPPITNSQAATSQRKNPSASGNGPQNSHAQFVNPYMSGSGFMNGYQGHLKDHVSKTGILPNPNGITQSLGTTAKPNMNNISSTGAQHQTSGSRPNLTQQPLVRQVTKSASIVPSDKKDAMIHPALRPEHRSAPTPMFHQQYQLSPAGPILSKSDPATFRDSSDPVNIPDVPPDSRAVVEQLMANLRKATANHTS